MKSTNRSLFWIFALLTAIGFDLMFWKKPWGINFFIFITLIVFAGLIPLWLGKIKVPWTSYLLLVPAGFFSLMTFFRAEPMTNFINGLIVFGSLIIFAVTLRNGAWTEMNLRDHIAQFLKFLLNCVIGGIRFFINTTKDRAADEPSQTEAGNGTVPTEEAQKRERKVGPVLRGILLAIPILIVLTLLLASADPVFESRVRSLFEWLSFDNPGEFLFRLTYILIIAYLLLSAFFFGSTLSAEWEKGHHTNPVIRHFLGTIESGIILGAVNLLFLVFVILQFTYLFGGQGNISIEGFTYAEYARRGFFELLAVAVISLVLFYALSLWTKRDTSAQRWVFSGMGVLLLALVGVILVSSYTRLSLYEAAYGFTRLRTITHIFTVWIGLILAVTTILEIGRKLDRLAFLLILLVFFFGATVNFLNIDSFIVQQNVTRALVTKDQDENPQLDADYLTTLSNDAIPPLITYFDDPALPDSLRDSIGGVLACRLASLEGMKNIPFTSSHYSRDKAAALLNDHAESLSRYPVSSDNGWLTVKINGLDFSCEGINGMD